ncbi:MAG: ATP-binding protein [Flavobacteriaceae bacterium]|nr:ATP-binding protein [Flavobacteriaceae bacterium]
MFQVLKKFSFLGIFLYGCIGVATAQMQTNLNPLSVFDTISTINGKFQYFFETSDKYIIKSAYDWRDKLSKKIEMANKAQDSSKLIKYQIILAQIHYDLGDYQESLNTANYLHQNQESLSKNELRYLLQVMDSNYGELMEYNKQLKIRQQKREYGFPGDRLYDIYDNIGLYDEAMSDYFHENRFLPDGDHLGQAIYWNQIAEFLRKKGSSLETAMKRYDAALNYLGVYNNTLNTPRSEQERAQAHWIEATIIGNIGKCKLAQKRYKDAIPDLTNAIEMIREYKQNKYTKEELDYMLDLAHCHMKLGNFQIAKNFLINKVPIKNPNSKMKRDHMLAEYYNKNQQFDSASIYYKRYIRMQDSLDNIMFRMKATALLADVDLERHRSEIVKYEKNIKETEGRIQEKDQTLTNTYIALGLTLFAITGLFLAYRKTVRSRRVINEQKKIIESSLIEKDSLLKEIHHRVKNNLQMVSSLLSIQAKNTKSKAAIEALEEGKSRVKAMALIHQKLYQNDDLSVIEMQGYIETLVNSIKTLYNRDSNHVEIEIDAANTELDIDRAIPFGLILNELVSNSYKYAFPNKEDGTIRIKLELKENNGYFEYCDDGIGLPTDMEERTKSSMGFNLVNRLVNQLKSHLNIDEKADGVRFWFNFS